MNKKKHIKGIKNILITIIVILGLLVICNSSKAANIVTYDFDSKIPSFKWKLNCGINNNQGIDNSKCLMLKSEDYEDAYAMISVEGLDENKKYCIEAYIKTSNIEKENDEEKKTGAFLDIYIGTETSNIQYITGTNSYKKVKINAYPRNGEICIMSKIGKAKGIAYIDNISVKESTDESIDFISSNKKIILRANTKTIEAIGSEKRLQTLVDNIGTAYYDINELTGTLPVSYRDNDAVLIDVTGEDLDWCLAYATYASGFIHCDANGFNKEMQKLKYRYENNLGEDWNFMILHELGHLFQGNVAWNFESEMMTDLQAAYVLEKNNVGAASAAFSAEQLFIGEQIKEAYKRSGKQLGKGSLEYGYDMYGAAAKFLDIKENIGWESFKKVYHELNKKYGTNSNLSKYEKFYEFVNALTIASGEDIQSYFNTEEWYSIVKYCGGYCESSEEKVQINNKENLKLKVGQNYKLEAILSTGEKTDIDWTSSDIEVATINSKGEITAKKRGTVVITAMSRKTGEFDTCTIIINEDLNRIRLSKKPEKTTYIEGEAFNKKGMEIVAIYKDGSSEVVTDYTIIGGDKLELNQTNVIISYTEEGITKTTVQPITVKAKEIDIRELENIEITNSPNKKEYIEGESFNRAGMTIIANYKDGTYREITNYRIKDGEKVEIGQESVTIEYTEGKITKEIKQNIIVKTKEIIGSWEISETAQDRVIATLYNNGVLSIQGTGKMKDYKDVNPPWDANKNDIKRIEIENGVEKIGERAFIYCSNLTKVTIPGSVKSIGYGAFRYCTNLTEVEIESGVEGIEEYVFQYCSNLNNVTIPGSVKSIGYAAFGDCTGLTEVEIESGLEEIGRYAFQYCSNLNNVTIPGSVKSIGYAAFGDCTSLSKIEIASAVTNIDLIAFYGCNNLTIYCNQDSHAEEYAKTNNIKYINKDVDSYLNNIKITSLPSKIEYVETENFDKTGMEVTATYNDGSKKVVTNYEIKDKENLKIGQESITIEYTEGEITKTAIQRIKVIEKELEIGVEEESGYEIKQDGEDIYLENIKLEETIETMLGNIETNGEIKIYKGTTEITDKNTKVATGMIIKITLKNETKEYKTVVTGDLNGDGQMNDIDVLMLGRYKAKLYEGLKGEYLRASDIVKNGEYAEDIDLLKMARILVGLDEV